MLLPGVYPLLQSYQLVIYDSNNAFYVSNLVRGRSVAMSGKRSGFGDFLTGVLVGGAIAYVIGLLNAPRPGDETRQMWMEQGRELRDRAMDTVQTTMDKTGKIVEDRRQRLNATMEETRNRVQERVSDLKDRGTEVFTDVRGQVSEGLRRTANQVDPNAPAQPPTPPPGPGI